MCSDFFNFRIINAIFRPPKKLDLEQWQWPLFEVLGYMTRPQSSPSKKFLSLSSVVDSSGDGVWVSYDSNNYFYVEIWFE